MTNQMNNENALVKTDTQLELARASNMLTITSRLLSKTFNAHQWWDCLDDAWKKLLFLNYELQSQQKLNFSEIKTALDASYLLSKYSDDAMPPISSELLTGITNMESLHCTGNFINSLEPIRNLTKVKRLNCSVTTIGSLEPIKNLTNLEQLDCSCTSISSLEPISNLTKLEQLNCCINHINSLEPIRNLVKLKQLNCFLITISSLDPIMNLPHLAQLDIVGTNISRLEVEKFIKLHPECEIECD